MKDAYKKVEEHNLDQEAFWGLDDAKIKELLGVEAYGERKHLITVMAEIKKKHEEEESKKRLELENDTKIIREEVIQLVTCA